MVPCGLFLPVAPAHAIRLPVDGRRTIAVLKRGLVLTGVTESESVGSGTPALSPEECVSFDAVWDLLQEEIAGSLPAHWRSEPREAEMAA